MSKPKIKLYTVMVTVVNIKTNSHCQTTMTSMPFNEVCKLWRYKCEQHCDNGESIKSYDVPFVSKGVGYINCRFENKYIHMFYF